MCKHPASNSFPSPCLQRVCIQRLLPSVWHFSGESQPCKVSGGERVPPKDMDLGTDTYTVQMQISASRTRSLLNTSRNPHPPRIAAASKGRSRLHVRHSHSAVRRGCRLSGLACAWAHRAASPPPCHIPLAHAFLRPRTTPRRASHSSDPTCVWALRAVHRPGRSRSQACCGRNAPWRAGCCSSDAGAKVSPRPRPKSRVPARLLPACRPAACQPLLRPGVCVGAKGGPPPFKGRYRPHIRRRRPTPRRAGRCLSYTECVWAEIAVRRLVRERSSLQVCRSVLTPASSDHRAQG